MKKKIVLRLLLVFEVAILMEPSSALAKPDDVVELRCSYKSGHGSSILEDEVDRITINLSEQKIRLWVSKKNDGFSFGNVKSPLKAVTSLNLDSNGVIDGTGHDAFGPSAFRYAQKDGRFQWVWIGGNGNVYQLEYNCWRID
jgi:hypothetical protein